MYINTTIIPSDYVRRFQMDGGGKSDTGSGDGTFTNATFQVSTIGYVAENVLWGGSTSFTYPSVTFTNSYLFKDGVIVKNSSEVTATALNGVNGSVYGLLTFFNRTLTSEEEKELNEEGLRIKGLSNAPLSGNFPKYSLLNLEEGKVLEISRPQSGGSYIDQTGNGNNGTPTNVTDSTNGLYNVMGFNGSSSGISIADNATLDIQNSITLYGNVNTNNAGATQYIITKRLANTNDGYELSFSGSGKAFVRFNQNSQGNTYRLDSLTNYQANKNQFWAATYDGTTIKIFLNGVLDNSMIASFTIGINNEALFIGRDAPNGVMDGDIIGSGIYNRALSDREMKQLFYSSKLI